MSGRRPAPRTPSGPEARAAAHRAAFFAAAERQFERFGYRKTTVEEICHAAGASKRTFYSLFNDKSDLAARWILDVSQAIAARWEASVPSATSAREKLERFLDEYEWLGRERPVFGQMVRDPDLLRAVARLADERHFQVLMDLVRRILAEGVRRGEFRKFDPDRMAWIFFSAVDSLYYLVPATGALKSPFEDEKLAGEVRGFLIHALLSTSKRKRS